MRQFTVKDIRRLISAASVPGHEKDEMVCVSEMNGAVFATDKAGDVFYYVGPTGSTPCLDRIAQPALVGAKEQRLYRDYWRYANFNVDDILAPYFASIAQGEYERAR